MTSNCQSLSPKPCPIFWTSVLKHFFHPHIIVRCKWAVLARFLPRLRRFGTGGTGRCNTAHAFVIHIRRLSPSDGRSVPWGSISLRSVSLGTQQVFLTAGFFWRVILKRRSDCELLNIPLPLFTCKFHSWNLFISWKYVNWSALLMNYWKVRDETLLWA